MFLLHSVHVFLVWNETANLARNVINSSFKAVVEPQWVTCSFTHCYPNIFTSSELAYGLFRPKLGDLSWCLLELWKDKPRPFWWGLFCFCRVRMKLALLWYLSLSFNNRDMYYDKTIVYLSKDPFYNVVRLDPVSDKHEHFLINIFTVHKKKSASRSWLILDIVA